MKALEGEVAAKARMAPNAAVTQGVQPTAKAAPKTKEVTYADLNVRTLKLCLRSKKGMESNPVR